ncbi:unnamed protein product [Ectocarpus sp. 4 AP-2014]
MVTWASELMEFVLAKLPRGGPPTEDGSSPQEKRDKKRSTSRPRV